MEGVNKIVNSKSRTFLALCFSFISGIGVFSFSDNTHLAFYLYISIFAVLFFLSFYWNDKIIKFALFCCLFFIFGGLRYFFSIPGDSPKHIRYFNGENKEIVGWASQEPERKIGQTKYVLTVIPREAGKSLSGKVLVSLPNYPEYQYGDEMVLSCLLQPPKDTVDSTFIYSKYLARDGIYSICSNPKIKSVRINARGNFFKKKLLSLKKRTGEQVERLWPEPESSLMAGLLYGARASLPQNLLDNFSRVGITHIIAISGFNISIIASILMISLIYSGLARPRAFWIAVSGIVLFVLFTGASASVVRAGIMGVIVLLAAQLGRLSRIGNVMAFTAAMMLVLNPFVLIWDAGFQLSFLATLGLVYLSPILNNYFISREKSESFFGNIQEMFVSTLSAIIATLPLILYQFGRFSLVAPLVNILVLWIIPWLMLFGFIALVFSFVIYPIGQVVAWLTMLGLKYVIILAEWFAGFSWSAVEVRMPWWGMVAAYFLMIALVVRFEKNK